VALAWPLAVVGLIVAAGRLARRGRFERHVAALRDGLAILHQSRRGAIPPGCSSSGGVADSDRIGVFQATCIGVLARAGVGPGPRRSYGLLLQATELVTALVLGLPAVAVELTGGSFSAGAASGPGATTRRR